MGGRSLMRPLVVAVLATIASPVLVQESACEASHAHHALGRGYGLDIEVHCANGQPTRRVAAKAPDGRDVPLESFEGVAHPTSLDIRPLRLTGGALADIYAPIDLGGYAPGFGIWSFDRGTARYRRVMEDAGQIERDPSGLVVVSGLSGLVTHFAALYRWDAARVRMRQIAGIEVAPGEPTQCTVTYQRDPITAAPKPPPHLLRNICAVIGKRYRLILKRDESRFRATEEP